MSRMLRRTRSWGMSRMLRRTRSRGMAMAMAKVGKFRKIRKRSGADLSQISENGRGRGLRLLKRCSSRGMTKSVVLRTCTKLNDFDPQLQNKKWEYSFAEAHRFFPSHPAVFYQDDIDQHFEICNFKANHTDNIIELSKGEHVDIVDLLSNQGKRDYLVNNCGYHVPVDSLKDKYVVLCCIPVPLPKNHVRVGHCRAIISARSYRTPPDFEIVIAAKMNSLWDREDVFDHFFSGFPSDALAIPFWDVLSRDRLFDSFVPISDFEICTLVVDPKGMVLQTDCVNDFRNYGSDFFPFTDEQLDKLDKEDLTLKLKWDTIYKEINEDMLRSTLGDFEKICSADRPSLTSLFGCTYLTKTDGTDARISLAELRKKVVGMYFCVDGTFFGRIYQFHKRCLKCDPDFVMVLVCYSDAESRSSFLDHIKIALKQYNINSWLLAPYCYKTQLILGRLTMFLGDEFIIVPPDGKSAEIGGKFITDICNFENLEYYPFTRESILDKRLSKLKSHTIYSLLSKDFTHLARGSMENVEGTCSNVPEGTCSDVPVAQLKGKNIILYFDCFGHCFKNETYCDMLKYYSDIKCKHRNSEVVFLPLHHCSKVPKMPWLLLPSPSDYVANNLLEDMRYTYRQRGAGTVVTFGADGRIRSRDAVKCLHKGRSSRLFDDRLRKEIVADLADWQDTYGCFG